MVKILSAAELRACDQYTILHEPVSSLELMERASRSFVSWFTERFQLTNKIGVVCGTGNNGGDGLAIARILKGWNYSVAVWIVRGSVNESPDFNTNLLRIGSGIEVRTLSNSTDHTLFQGCDVLIDAVFGTGLSRPAGGIYEQVIKGINNTACLRIAVDVPSGLMIDAHTTGAVVHADHTVTFQFPKLAFLLPENSTFVGDWHCVDIRLSNDFIRQADSPYRYLNAKGVKKKIKIRSKFENKGDHGKALLIAGSFGKMGACILAARAALRAGVGLLTVHVPAKGYDIIQSSVPEAMASVDESETMFTAPGSLDNFTIIAIGPGIGKDTKTKIGFEKVLAAGKPMVIDADALNLLGENRELLNQIPAGSILTPHPKEFERLAGPWADDFERLAKQVQLARTTNTVVILKGAHTSIATPDGKVYFNSTGNPGMATGGAGDVLTGIVAGFLAQGYSPPDAAIAAVYLHGLSGDVAALQNTTNSMIASDLIEFLPAAFKKIGPPTQ